VAAARDPLGVVFEVVSMSEAMVIRESDVHFSNCVIVQEVNPMQDDFTE
jgi:hypothetical protein